MLNFFDMIVDFFTSIWQIIVNLVSGLINAILIVFSSVEIPLKLIAFVPSFISASVTIVIAVGITKLIIGWGNS